ncbi:MAG: penicillin-binding transpeptidase domain-containing protein [Lachnospira pectinoschiza]
MRWSSYNAAGKTGSAQYDNSDNVHSWFVGFAPADTRDLVSVVLEGGIQVYQVHNI